MSKITYQEADGPRGRRAKVKLDGKYVGMIAPDGRDFRYFPKGSNVPGRAFPSVDGVKRSLETDEG